MEASSYTDTILLQANRKSSAEYISGNNEEKSSWTNALGSGVKLDIGDTISVHSAYISEIGNEDATIEIKGRDAINNLGEKQSYISTNVTLKKTEGELSNGVVDGVKSSNGNYSWDYTIDNNVENTIRDDEINLTHSYYKCAQGDNYIVLPRRWATDDIRGWWDAGQNWAKYESALNGLVNTENPYRLGLDYSDIRKYGQATGWGFSAEDQPKSSKISISHDGRRYTLFVRKSFKNYTPDGQKTGFTLQGERDPALMDFIWYKKTVKYKVKQGFNSPANVASQITNKMNDVSKIENISIGEEYDENEVLRDGQVIQNNINLEAQSNTFEIFPCATSWFIRNAGELWFDDSYRTDITLNYKDNASIVTEKYQNAFYCDVGHPYQGGVTYQYFTDNLLRVGWKVVSFKNVTTNTDVSAFSNLIGSSVTTMREYLYEPAGGEISKGTLISLSKNFGNASNTITNASRDMYGFTYTNEHLPMLYESCYSTIGYLRPEIQEKGRALMNKDKPTKITIDGCYYTHRIFTPMKNADEDKKSAILTRIPWTDENLLLLKNLFDAQSLYPELFNYDGMSASQKALINVDNTTKTNVSVNTMRFLHMNDAIQTGFLNYNPIYKGVVNSEFGVYIEVDSVTSAKTGMKLIYSTGDDENGRFFPLETFITYVDVGNKRLYVNNPFNIENVPVVDVGFVSFSSAGIGSDKYTSATNLANSTHTAGAVFFDYNPSRAEISIGFGDSTPVYDTLAYGFAKRYKVGNDYFIGLSVEKYQNGELPVVWFDGSNEIDERCIGFDKHFNAYGTSAILLTNGDASLWGGDYNASNLETNEWSGSEISGNPNSDTFPTNIPSIYNCLKINPSGDGWFISKSGVDEKFGPQVDDPLNARYFNEIYCGSNQPSLQFDSDSSRFSFVNLHTPERIGTNATLVLNGSDVADADLPCYKLNKRLDRMNFSPDFIPYNNVYKISASSSLTQSVRVEKDNAISPYTIMDAQGGIFLEDYGCDEKNWSQSLWELLGFTYSQFHNKGSRLQRLSNDGLLTSTPTTNANVKTEDLQNFTQSGLSNIPINNTLEINYPSWLFSSTNSSGSPSFSASMNATHFSMPGNQMYPPVSQQATSTIIEADNLPRKMLSPIYLIKSDILNPKYVGGRDGTSTLPIIAVVDKSSGYGDFYTGATNSTIFTNTIPRTIQNIKTSIVDADGSESRVDDSCCVIYKVTKQIKNNSVVLQNILNPVKK